MKAKGKKREWANSYRYVYEKIRDNEKDINLVDLVARYRRLGSVRTRLELQARNVLQRFLK